MTLILNIARRPGSKTNVEIIYQLNTYPCITSFNILTLATIEKSFQDGLSIVGRKSPSSFRSRNLNSKMFEITHPARETAAARCR